MDLARINISTTQAQTGIQSQRPPMSIHQPQADMHIDQEFGSIRISTTASQLFIDQTEAFADADLKGPLRRSDEFAARSMQNVMQYIAKTTQQGDQMKKIEHGTNAIASIAKQNGERPTKQINYGTVPEHMGKVSIDYRPSDISIQADRSEPTIRVHKNDPQIHIPRWESNVYLQQKNHIDFSVSGGSINRQL
ncbi:hypothetical protein CR194_14125 [Salipaludibacillus keqinensis]|uniref:YviE n=1 Tax=Salipaludibacillus keqinensis TaxID=2045207 RepID=A0A323TDQ1_9BACI|nr:DUF6470 family protein [Salipaludibacillus keqinensis]PYZ92786.1 hypothetical protein CR194_14125 [Salipaludibacillus keqinensis]